MKSSKGISILLIAVTISVSLAEAKGPVARFVVKSVGRAPYADIQRLLHPKCKGVRFIERDNRLVATIARETDVGALRTLLLSGGYGVSKDYLSQGMSPDQAVRRALESNIMDHFIWLDLVYAEPELPPRPEADHSPTAGAIPQSGRNAIYQVEIQTGALGKEPVLPPYCLHSARSPNRSPEDRRTALELGSRTLPSEQMHIYAGLPRNEAEAHSLGLGGSLGRSSQSILAGLSADLEKTTAKLCGYLTYEDLKSELLERTQDALFLLFHNEDNCLVLSDIKMTFKDFQEEFRLDKSPTRIIYLLTCSQGTVNETEPSLAEIILENRLARTVFAPRTEINIQEAIDALRDLYTDDGNSLRSRIGTRGIMQIVITPSPRQPFFRNEFAFISDSCLAGRMQYYTFFRGAFDG